MPSLPVDSVDDSYEPSRLVIHHDPDPLASPYHHGQPAPPIRSLSPPPPIGKTDDAQLSAEDQATITKYEKSLSLANMEHGLSEIIISKQRLQYGYNETIEKKISLWLLFALKFWGVTPIMIMIAMIIAFSLGNYVDGIVIAVLLVMNACIAFHEDVKAQKSLRELMKKLQITSRVLRDGKWVEIASRELVPGDLVRIRTGDISGADMIIMNGQLSIDQSALTGESALKNKSRYGLVYAGAIIKRGEANAVVVATGPATYFGETAKLVQSSAPNAHINRILTRIVIVLMSIVIALVILSLIIMGIKHDNMIDALPLLLMIIVTALPVALPAMFTVSMALGSQELSNKAVLVTRLNVLEDAAMMSLLFSDKTGTLTQNHLTVKEITPIHPNTSKHDILLTASLCSRQENADPIDLAILEAYHNIHDNKEDIKTSNTMDPKKDEIVIDLDKSNIEMEEMKIQDNDGLIMDTEVQSTIYPSMELKSYQSLHFIPFDASNRRTEAQLSYTPSTTSSQQPFRFHVTKGAVATLCHLCYIDETSDTWKSIEEITINNANKGYRTIATCQSLCHGDNNHPHPINSSHDSQTPLLSQDHPQYQLLGLIALYDPPRTDSHHIISHLLSLGIQTKMLTGDAINVACEIGDILGLGRNFINLEQEKKLLKSGDDMKSQHDPHETSDEDMIHLLSKYDPLTISGFAQIFPSDKHYIVKHTQNRGYICGMTGDGVNDAPALKQAEVGCAVSNATDVAKGCASALLLNDGLSGVIDMVSVGRQIHRRVEIWFMNKVAKASQQSLFILIMFLILGRFPISALQVVILLLLMDFVLISLATDRQQPGSTPSQWKLAQLTRIGLVVGLLGAGEMMILILSAEYFWKWDAPRCQTLAWECMFYWGMFSVFSVREKRVFWSSKPSTIMLSIVVLESFLVWIICSVGISSSFESLGWGYSSMITGIALACFVINDAVKTLYIKWFESDILK